MIERLCIVGVGLMGGSLAIALRRAGYCREIVGTGRNRANLEQAVALGVIDRFETEPAAAVAGADMVLLAVPLGSVASVVAALRSGLSDTAILTDVGSAKGSVVADITQALGYLPPRFVPGHPIAGNERSGVSAAFGELYQGHRVILTPLAETEPAALQAVTTMWQTAGAEVETMAVAHHDEILAATSHLPHMLAFALVDSLARLGEADEIFRYAAGGFRDFTRIASSDPHMWRDICIANREALGAMFEHFRNDMLCLEEAVARADGETLSEMFSRAKQARDRFYQTEPSS